MGARGVGARQDRCSFCGKERREVPELFGHSGRFICSECNAVAALRLLELEREPPAARPRGPAGAECSFCGLGQGECDGPLLPELDDGRVHARICRGCVERHAGPVGRGPGASRP